MRKLTFLLGMLSALVLTACGKSLYCTTKKVLKKPSLYLATPL